MKAHRCAVRRHDAAFLFTLAALLLLSPLRARAVSMNRFLLASQDDFGAKRGFYVDFENEAPDGQVCKLASLKLYLAVASGTEWHFPSYTPPGGWLYDHDYTVRDEIGAAPGGGATMYVDGEKVAEEPAAHLTPFVGPLTAGERPAWASGPAEYVIRQTALRLTVGGGASLTVPFPSLAERPLPVYLFEPNTPVRPQTFALTPGAALTITATFRLERFPTDLHPFAPFVDAFGQSRHASWPGKIASDADLTRAMAEETKRNAAWGAPKDRDGFGGDRRAPWHEKATGFFRTIRREGRWWLISPDGNPEFYTGLCTAPAVAWDKTSTTGREYLFASLPPHTPPPTPTAPTPWGQDSWGGEPGVDYVALHSANMIRKYGDADWANRAKTSLAQRISVWGFSGMAKWCDPVAELPRMPVLGVSAGDVPRLGRHVDVFDPAIRAAFAAKLKAQIEPRKADPTLLGWSYGNEYDEIVTRSEVRDILRQHPDSPAARAFVDYARTKLYAGDEAKRAAAWPNGIPNDTDTEALRRFYADRYYDLLYTSVKAADPNHLYFGFWIVPGWWENEEDWRLIAPHCDVIGYDRYAPTFADDRLDRLTRETNKPIFCGEFSFPPWYDGLRGFGRFEAASTATDAESGDAYTRWISDAARNPYCIGVSWFQYRDEPITGRGPGHGDALVYGEHYAFGLVDVTDTPKWDLVGRVREANLHATDWRLHPSSGTGK